VGFSFSFFWAPTIVQRVHLISPSNFLHPETDVIYLKMGPIARDTSPPGKSRRRGRAGWANRGAAAPSGRAALLAGGPRGWGSPRVPRGQREEARTWRRRGARRAVTPLPWGRRNGRLGRAWRAEPAERREGSQGSPSAGREWGVSVGEAAVRREGEPRTAWLISRAADDRILSPLSQGKTRMNFGISS